MRASSWRKHVPLEERVGQLNNGTQDINNVENIEGALHRGANSMEMETNKEEMSGVKLFELDPNLFDRRLETHTRLELVTEEQRKEYLDSLPCVLCGRMGGICHCGVTNVRHKEKNRRKKRKKKKR